MKRFILCCVCCLMAACSVVAQAQKPMEDSIPFITEDAKVQQIDNLFFVHTAKNAYVFERQGEHQYRLLVYVPFPRTSEEQEYITKTSLEGDTLLFQIHFKCHNRWYKKELGSATHKDGKFEWVE